MASFSTLPSIGPTIAVMRSRRLLTARWDAGWTMRTLVKVAAGLLVAACILSFGVAVLNWAPDRPVSELAARWAPPPSAFIDIAGMNVHLRDEGPQDDPMPVVLLHGTSASLHTWEGWARAFVGKRRVVRFDMPGFGLTGPAPDNDYRIERYAAFVLAMLDRLGIDRCVLAGSSFGGHVAWVTALMAPERVGKLVLVDAGGYPQQPESVPLGFRIVQVPILARLAQVILPRSVIELSLRNVYGDPGKVTPDLVDLYYAMAVRQGNRKALAHRFKQAAPLGLELRIREVKQPTLILWGGRDRLIPPANAERFRRDIPDSRLVMFDKLGHVPHEEGPAETAAAVERFLTAE
jgi:pimeloyl-ACP methyl ester carboxylesterase